MNKIVFFSIPAYGHTNPTIEVVRTLTQRGNIVRYYSFHIFREKIEATGAQFVSCDAYMPPIPKNIEHKIKYDFSSLIGMVTHVTISMKSIICAELQDFRPDCIVSDSICIWGKLFAIKMNIPLICSTTTFAFNAETAKMMKPRFRELFYMLIGIPKINKNVRQLRQHGYEVENITQLIQNDNETDTIVYTSREFQPLSETFGEKYTFIGPSIHTISPDLIKKERPLIYISLGTVISIPKFYQNCIDALRSSAYDVIMSVKPEDIKAAIAQILNNKENYLKKIKVIANSFCSAGGPEKAADKIVQVIHTERW